MFVTLKSSLEGERVVLRGRRWAYINIKTSGNPCIDVRETILDKVDEFEHF